MISFLEFILQGWVLVLEAWIVGKRGPCQWAGSFGVLNGRPNLISWRRL